MLVGGLLEKLGRGGASDGRVLGIEKGVGDFTGVGSC